MKRNIKVYEKYANEESKLFFLEITEQCNFLCISDGEFLFDYNDLTDDKLNKLEEIKNYFETAEDITKVALMPNRTYEVFSYSNKDTEFCLTDKTLKEFSIDREFLYKSVLLFEDMNEKINLFVKCRAKFSDRTKTNGYYRLNIFNNKKGCFVSSIEKEEIESISVSLYGYINSILVSLEKIEDNPIKLGYKLTSIENLRENLKDLIKGLNYSDINKLNTGEIRNILDTKYRSSSDYYTNKAISYLSIFNLSNIDKLNLFKEVIHAPGHYDDIYTISFSNKEIIPDNGSSFYFLDSVRI